MRIVETDNFGGDYPNETFVNVPFLTAEHAKRVADALNAGFPSHYDRFWKVVENDYVLSLGFEP